MTRRAFIIQGGSLTTVLLCGCAEELESPSKPPKPYVRQVQSVIDFPRLAFLRRRSVEKHFGRAIKSEKSFDQDGLVVWYQRAVVNYRWNRLYGMDYAFRKKPANVKQALELIGLEMRVPHEADTHVTYRWLNGNPLLTQPLECGEIVFQYVAVPKELDSIQVLLAPWSSTPSEWPQATRLTLEQATAIDP